MNAKVCNVMVPENIARLIDERGLKQCAVAERANLSSQQLCDMINGRKIIKVSTFVLLYPAFFIFQLRIEKP